MVSARPPDRQVRALNLGADDYVASRSASRTPDADQRHAAAQQTIRPNATEPTSVRIRNIKIDLERRQGQQGGLVHLTPTSFTLLRRFAVARGVAD